MIVQYAGGALMAEHIRRWSLWWYSDTDTEKNTHLQVTLDGVKDDLFLWEGSRLIAKELLRLLPAWVDGHLKAGTPEINLEDQICRLLAERGGGP